MEWYTLIKPIGILTYILLSLNVLLGLFMKKIKLKSKFKIHIWLGVIALISATFHFLLVYIYT
ncbi:MAG: hypothetical protein JXB50_06185 [Spirochaetes bacterium]|nr:hypothetical protein [Spirochaetota bacterium]